MTCPYSREDLSAYIDAEVDETIQARIREHVRVCPKCKREVAWLRTLAQMVGDLPRVELDTTVTWSTERRASQPSQTMRCPVVLPEASAFLDGELPAADAQAVLAHLAACDPCYHAFRDIERISEAMIATEPAAVPAGLEERLMAAVHAERRFSLRRLFGRTCEACVPAARVSLRWAAAAAFVLAVLFGVWHVVAPRGHVPVVPVTGPTVAVAPAVNDQPGASDTPAPRATPERPAHEPEPARLATAPRVPTEAPDRGWSAALYRPTPTAPRGGTTPTAVRPAPDVPTVPVAIGPDRTTTPQPDASHPRSMLASLPPSHPSPPTEPGTPATSRPSVAIAKSTHPGDAAVTPPPVRVAELPPAGDTDAEADVHVARSGPGASAPAVAGGLDWARVKAAEARLNATVRDVARAQPKRFPINP